MDLAEWKAEIERAREAKDTFFDGDWQSPISAEDRFRFGGLEYYPPDPDYRFELELHEHPDKRVVPVVYTKGDERDFLRWGEFRFSIDGKQQVLQAYKMDSRDQTLFVPFRDATSGKKTYGAGRYLDLEADRDRAPDGKWVLDFNVAYNPWCAYSEKYTCPVVPVENWLEVPVPAGERSYPLHRGY